MRAIVLSVALFLVTIFTGSTLGASNLDRDSLQKLLQLEKQYFGRSYEADSDDSRVARLEKYVFGEPVVGAPQERIENLASTTAFASALSRDSNSSTTAPTVSPTFSRPAPAAYSQPAAMSSVNPNENDTSDNYPHITALENAILGQSHSGQPLPGRLERMEMKAFGGASSNLDLSQRTDALDDYAARQLHKERVQKDAESETAKSNDAEPIQNQADYPHITALEKAILSQTFVGESLVDRLRRMEIKAFGSASNSPDLSQRTDALERYAEKKLHKKAPGQQTSETASSSGQSNSRAPKLLSMLGQGVLGLAGLGGGGLGGGMGSGGMGAMGMGAPGMGFGGMGLGGMGLGGMGMGGMGRGGMRRQQAAQSAQQPIPEAETHKDDPQVYDPTPPPPNARMLTKVGWCEMQVFGHTFANMHLPERLGQLSREVNFEPGKSDVALMDDVWPLIKAVQARKQTGQAIGSGTQPTAR